MQNPAIFNSILANLGEVQTPEEMMLIGKTGINYGVRNKLFWRHYFTLCRENFMDSEKGFNDFFRLNVSRSLGGLKSGEWLNDSILRKFRNEVEGCRYLMLMMVTFDLIPTIAN